MSSCPFTNAFHCSLGLKSEAPGKTCTSRPTFAAFASRAMICTISSRTSPLPPGNWCAARSVTLAPKALVARAAAPNAARMRVIFTMVSPPGSLDLWVFWCCRCCRKSGGGAVPFRLARGARQVLEGREHAAFLERHAGELETHLDARERSHEHQVVEVAEVADAEDLSRELAQALAERHVEVPQHHRAEAVRVLARRHHHRGERRA